MGNKYYLIIGGLFGFMGVALGAFGAHALQNQISKDMLEIYRTGVMYHLIHAVAIIALAVTGRNFKVALLLFMAGIILFSFSLYIYSLTAIDAIAMITPIGGLCFLAGWLAVAYYGIKK